jgi:hypothetical protein
MEDPVLKSEIKYKELFVFNYFKNCIFNRINKINSIFENFQNSSEPDIYPEIVKDIRAIIVGGAAFEYYFKVEEEFATHDFDLRFVYLGDISKLNIPLNTQHTIETIINGHLFSCRNMCLKIFTEELNKSISEFNIFDINKSKKEIDDYKNLLKILSPVKGINKDGNQIDIYFYEGTNIVVDKNGDKILDEYGNTQFDFVKKYKNKLLLNIVSNYNIKGFEKNHPGYKHKNAIIDMVILDMNLATSRYNNDPDLVNKLNMGELVDSIKSGKINHLQGYFPKSLISPNSYKKITFNNFNNIYIISLGFLIWDSVKMMNISIDMYNYKLKKNDMNGAQKVKLKNYIRKYSKIIEALENPLEKLTCNPESMKNYVNKCYNEINNISSQSEKKRRLTDDE